MTNLSPPVRAALVLLVLVSVLAIGAVAALLSDRWDAAEAAARHELAAAATTLASTLPTSIPGDLEGRLAAVAEVSGIRFAVFDEQRLIAVSDPSLEALDPQAVPTEEGAAPGTAYVGGEERLLALARAPSGLRVLAVRSVESVAEVYGPSARYTIFLAVIIWLVCLAGFGAFAWYAGRHTTTLMQAFAERLATLGPNGAGEAQALLAHAPEKLGPYAEPFGALSEALYNAHAKAAEAKSHVAALLQINPHYVLICTLEGRIVDANPAFYAMTGLPQRAIQDNPIEVLNDVMPVEPLFELARRSFRENAAIGGIEYALINRDDSRRQVQVSLRAVHMAGKEAVMVQATDVANQRHLERQIATFSDTLDLMVDQRVAQLTAGNASLSKLLDIAGVIVVSFDAGGGTRRWSRSAEALTGREGKQVPHFTAFMGSLNLAPRGRAAFSEWFWGPKVGSFVSVVSGTDGLLRRMLWRKAVTADETRAESRILIGAELARAMPGDGSTTGTPSVHAVSEPEPIV